jgi:uncharacterized membrane protein YeaQ/YmgE (transglycosylase-associated protein family)
MGLIAYLIILVFLGLIVGALARLLMPGPDPMSIPATIGLGLAGNFVAGLIVWAVWGHGAPGLIISVLFSMLILYFVRRSRGGGLTRPGA